MTAAGSDIPTLDSRRSYDADIVDRHIADLRSEIDSLRRSLDGALRQAGAAQGQGMPAQKAEELIGKALLSADRRAEQLIADGERRARQLISDAHEQSDAIVAAADRKAEDRLNAVRVEAQKILDEAHESVRALFSSLPSPAAAPPAPVAAPAPVAPSSAPPASDASDVSTAPLSVAPPEEAGSQRPTIVRQPPRLVPPLRETPPGAEDTPRAQHTLVVRRTDPWPAPWLQRTGTDDPVILRPIHDPDDDDFVWDGAEPARATPAAGPLASLMERWRFARAGEQFLDDGCGTRSAYLDSATDGSFVDQLRDPSDLVRWRQPPSFDHLEDFATGDVATPRIDRRRWEDEPIPPPLPVRSARQGPRHFQEPARRWRGRRQPPR